ncbi:MAG: primase [Epulopiscium sp.]|jgi:DNA primase|uniref:DNA primase n=1 Tax=Defluviitalea raffinosedens TaxID=1450156 RepID=A0A7C8HHF9_9FIRM|nr:DNA primase [Defluviitalea raffinosedens]MBZ4667967.1 primase [Defluviitaleaceae bacterium]MDK2788313.1 primase [Candidatus Epulonipiscium sp.]KAE9636993.1 DNA primase [Defluviitalea raffinosedens]MBM7685253.1 DNA primase [Defluviitalea raffinosedens]HHW67308.1 DNA primase [Candidatus Epulonipiscium sp.]
MYYSEEIIEEIRSQNDLVDVVSEYVRLQRKGSSYFGLCPFHNEDTPSFSVSPDKQMYYCFGCQAGGNVFTFIMQMENFSFVEAIKHLADRAHITLPQPEYSEEVRKKMEEKQILLDMHKEAAKYFYANLRSLRGQQASEYLNKRKLSKNTQKLFGIGYSNMDFGDLYQYLLYKGYEEEHISKSGLVIPKKKGKGYVDRFRNRIMFPIFDVHNQVIGFGGRVLDDSLPKYMNSPDTPLFDKSKNLYGLNYARTSGKNQILIVEGYMDVISLYQAGFENVVASLGTAFTYQQASLLKRYTGEVVIIYDSDTAGTNAALRAIPILSSAGLKIKVVQVPGEKDPDDFIKQNGPEAFQQLLDHAMGAVTFQVSVLRKKYNIEDTEQKIKFTMEVAQLLSRLDNEIERDVYLQEISNDTKISTQSILNEIKKTQEFQRKNSIKLSSYSQRQESELHDHLKVNNVFNNIDEKNGLYKAQKNILNFLYNNPLHYHKIKPHLSYEDFIDPVLMKVAKLIYEQYDKGLKIEPAVVINHFENLNDQKQVSMIFRDEKSKNQEYDIEKAINDQIKLIKKANIDMKSRNATDIYEIQSLIEQKKQLEKLYINLISG